MPNPALLRPSILTTLCGLMLLGGCFSATPTRPTKTKDASADGSDRPADVQLNRLPDVGAGGSDGGAGSTGGNTDASTGGAGGATTAVSTTPDAGFVPDAPVAPPDVATTRDTAFVPDAPVAPVDALLGIGAPCTSHGACSSTYCIDGVCCDGKCEGNCESCVTSTCTFSPRPRTACPGSGKCAGTCLESNTKECTFPNDKTVCAAQSCTAGVRTDKAFCDGKGVCPAQTKTNCTGALCLADGSDCATCTDDSSAMTCAGGHCGPTANNCGHTVQCSATCSGTGQTCGGGGSAGLCGCTSASKTETCGTSNCGTAIDNCGKQISCGTCSPGSPCMNGTCCTPACTNKCGGVSDGCNGICSAECGANSICQSGTCQSCGTLTACGGACVNTSTSSTNCGQCGRACSPGQACCSGTCADLNSSGANCGTCGRSCGSQTCMAGICCDSTSVNCGGSCCDPNHSCAGSTCGCPGYGLSCGGCPVWNFETNSTEGWFKTPFGLRPEDTSGNAIQSIAVGSSRFVEGSHSLSVRISTSETNRYATIAVPLCPSGAAVSLPAGITFSASFYFVSDTGSMPFYVSAMTERLGPDYDSTSDPDIATSFPGGTWITYRATFATGGSATHIAFFWLPGSDWAGTMYIDRVKLSM